MHKLGKNINQKKIELQEQQTTADNDRNTKKISQFLPFHNKRHNSRRYLNHRSKNEAAEEEDEIEEDYGDEDELDEDEDLLGPEVEGGDSDEEGSARRPPTQNHNQNNQLPQTTPTTLSSTESPPAYLPPLPFSSSSTPLSSNGGDDLEFIFGHDPSVSSSTSSPCSSEDEFLCHASGECLPLSRRCDRSACEDDFADCPSNGFNSHAVFSGGGKNLFSFVNIF